MIRINKVHHIAVICSNYEKSLQFYTGILGFKLEKEVYRESRQSHKADLYLNGDYTLELFSFPDPPSRVSNPEALGLRHLAFEVDRIEESLSWLKHCNVATEPVRLDEITGKRFFFIADPDGLPIEFYEA
jgi:glyoxylase I family protein